MDDPRQRSSNARLGMDVGYNLGYSSDYPVGSLDYRIAITAKDGRTATFTPPIQKAKTADTRVRIID
jgi:hypothetical protein